MDVVALLLGVSVLALVIRAVQSDDVRWMRWLGWAAAAITTAIVPLGALIHLQLSTFTGLALLSAAPIYLVVWASLSRDRELHRIASLVAALPGAFAVFTLYMFATNYSE